MASRRRQNPLGGVTAACSSPDMVFNVSRGAANQSDEHHGSLVIGFRRENGAFKVSEAQRLQSVNASRSTTEASESVTKRPLHRDFFVVDRFNSDAGPPDRGLSVRLSRFELAADIRLKATQHTVLMYAEVLDSSKGTDWGFDLGLRTADGRDKQTVVHVAIEYEGGTGRDEPRQEACRKDQDCQDLGGRTWVERIGRWARPGSAPDLRQNAGRLDRLRYDNKYEAEVKDKTCWSGAASTLAPRPVPGDLNQSFQPGAGRCTTHGGTAHEYLHPSVLCSSPGCGRRAPSQTRRRHSRVGNAGTLNTGGVRIAMERPAIAAYAR
ncbi:hypothetical protein B0H11DRAFT_1919791 [Mycena galericulata]|nr:hypothetical protein B0H11DRAFT_1919791 [Mycena galericulata]